MDAEPVRVADTRCDCAEGPLWHPGEDALYWVDIEPGHLYRYDPRTDAHERVHDSDLRVGGLTVQADGALLLYQDYGRVTRWDDGETETVVDRVEGEGDTRFNDVIADPAGRVFAGTMPGDDHGGRLYRLDSDTSVHRVLDGVGVPNGLGFTPDDAALYFTDSGVDRVYRFAYDANTGANSDRETVVDASDDPGTPDGMTVDAEGYLWTARWGGGRLVRHAPDGTEVASVPFPAERVSACAFGGPEYGTLYATTAGGDNRAEEGDGAGAVFAVDVDVGGRPEHRSRVG